MSIRVLAGAAAIAVTGVLAYGLYQQIPPGQPLARSEVIGELDGPPLAGYSRTRLYRFGAQQFLTGQLIAGPRDIEPLQQAPVLDALLPTHADSPLRNAAAAREVRNLVYGGRDNGRYALLGSIGGDTGVSLIAGPLGQTLYLVAGPSRDARLGAPGAVSETLRSDDQGASWRYESDVALGPPQRHTAFLTPARVVALQDGPDGERLLHSEDGARTWWAISLREQVWPDAARYDKAFREQAARARDEDSTLAYGWSLYPLASDLAVGWSWRERGGPAGPERIETRRFEVRFQDGASPAFRIAPAPPPVPAQDPEAQVQLGQPVFETAGNRIYRLDATDKTWHAVAATPTVRGARTRIGQAWFGRNGWVVKTYARHLFSFGDGTRTYFYTGDQGRTWRPFQLSPDQERGLLGLDAAGKGLLVHAEQGGKTVILRYALDDAGRAP